MNIPQTTVAQYFTEALLGMLAFITEMRRQVSYTAKGIIYFGRTCVFSKLYFDQRNYPLVRLPRSNKFTQAFTGTMSAGTVATTITSGTITSGNVTGSTSSKTVTTNWSVNLATTMGLHATTIAAAMADCYSCAYSSGTLTYIGDANDLTAVSTAFASAGSGDTAAAAAATISTNDAITDVAGISFLTSDRQQTVTTGYNYYSDQDPVNLLTQGTVWVNTEVAVNPSDTVYTRFTQDSNGWVGDFSNVADSATNLALTGAKFLKHQAAAGLEPLTINLPQ